MKATVSVAKVVTFTDAENDFLKRVFGDQLTAFLEAAGGTFSVYLTEKRNIENALAPAETLEQITKIAEEARRFQQSFAELPPEIKNILKLCYPMMPDKLRESVLDDAAEGLNKIIGPCRAVQLQLKPQRGNPGKDLEKNLISDLKAIYVSRARRRAMDEFESVLDIILPHAGIKTTDRRRLRKKAVAR